MYWISHTLVRWLRIGFYRWVEIRNQSVQCWCNSFGINNSMRHWMERERKRGKHGISFCVTVKHCISWNDYNFSHFNWPLVIARWVSSVVTVCWCCIILTVHVLFYIPFFHSMNEYIIFSANCIELVLTLLGIADESMRIIIKSIMIYIHRVNRTTLCSLSRVPASALNSARRHSILLPYCRFIHISNSNRPHQTSISSWLARHQSTLHCGWLFSRKL